MILEDAIPVATRQPVVASRYATADYGLSRVLSLLSETLRNSRLVPADFGDIMGLLDDLLGGKKESGEVSTGNAPFKISVGFSPVRLAAMKDNKVNMVITLTNTSGENQLVSLDVMLPKKELVGFEPTCIKKHEERKVGDMKDRETKEIVVALWATNQTRQGTYQIGVNVYAHYLDYTKVIKSVKKIVTVRVV